MSDRSELIRRRAYQMWEERGRPEGLDAEHWYAAEQELAEDDAGPETEALRDAEEAEKDRNRGNLPAPSKS
jgi:hypothetical protein